MAGLEREFPGQVFAGVGFDTAVPPLSNKVAAFITIRCSGAGPATRHGVRENQVGTPGKRTGPCGVATVSNKPTAFR
jgi:hypothetical protein